MGFPDRPEPKSEHIEKPFKEIEKQFKEGKDKDTIKAEHKDIKEKENIKAEHKDFKEIKENIKEKDKEKDKDKEIKENVKAEHKDFKEIKENIKEIKVEIKEHPEKPIIKEHPEKPLKEKDKDKDMIEGSSVEQLGDPLALLHSLHARVSSIEEHLGVGAEAFVQPEERPPVGGSVAEEAKERPSKASQAGKEE